MHSVPFESGSPVVVDRTLTDAKLTELLALGHEWPELDYKRRLDLKEMRDEVELAKDVGAFQVLGGYIVLGVDDHGTPTPDMDGVDLRLFDEARLVPKLEKYLPGPFKVPSRVFERDGQKVVLICVHASPRGYAIFRINGQYDGTPVFRAGAIYWRNGTRSEPISPEGLETIIKWRIEKGISDQAVREPLDAAIGRFIREEQQARNWTQKTINEYTGVLARLASRHPDLTVADFDARNGGTDLLINFIDKEWRGTSAITRGNKARLLKSFFAWCYQRELIRSDPAKRLRVPGPAPRARRAPTKRQVDGLIAAQDNPRDRVALALLGRVGLKKGELRLLRYGDFDLDEQTVRVPPTHRREERHVKIADTALLADLRQLRINEKRSRREYVLHARVQVGNLKGVPPGTVKARWDQPMASTSIHRWFKGCVERTPGVSDVAMDGLRLAAIRDSA
jgi:integrase